VHLKWGLSRRRGSEQKDREPSQAFANNTGVDVVVVVGVVVPDLGEDADEPLVIAPIVGICADLVIGAYAGNIQLDHEILTRGSAVVAVGLCLLPETSS
jgi:hypothetical protein